MRRNTLLLGIICNEKTHEIDTLQAVNQLYLNAIATHMDVQPVLIPIDRPLKTEPLLSRLDGLLITGNRSNVHPSHFGVEPSPAYEPYDENRDATAFALIRSALAADLPLLAICRGFQELNVVLGGSLMTNVHKMDDRLSHRTPKGYTHDARFAARHMVQFVEGGYFDTLLGTKSALTNSLHWQAVDRLADELVLDAIAEDGVIEAATHKTASYCVGVQWHPEYQNGENMISEKLFGDFECAMRKRK
jgi:putative glutamine amidotransferase